VSKIIKDLKIGLDDDLAEKLKWLYPNCSDYRILRQSIDARRKGQIHFVYSVELAEQGERLERPKIELKKVTTQFDQKPIIIGAGPAGLFAALRFVEQGVKCLLLERGSPAETRIKKINRFWRYGELDPQNNVCFGEGGAGLYSDGKLITRIKSPHIPYVLNRLVQFGAPPEIEYLANPHVGSDKIRRLIPRVREFLIANGCEIHFDTCVTKVLASESKVKGVETNHGPMYSKNVILATGHSATDVIKSLNREGIFLEGKSFAMGLRIEHPQKLINERQYREFHSHPKLKAANYRLTDHDHKTGIGVYSFCMCPGGFVLSSGTEPDGLVCNGMSNFNRGSDFANAAIVVSLNHEELFGSDLWGGMKLRRELEKKAFQSIQKARGTKQLPAQNVLDFLDKKISSLPEKVSSPSGAIPVRLDTLMPSFIYEKLVKSLTKFDNLIPGFAGHQGYLYGVESRTSCPIRVTRDSDTLQSLSHEGLYPCGEGAGYAGGITSAACDGVKVADKIIEQLK
jgi:uncharacterized FAD-dependent dehydrogenase